MKNFERTLKAFANRRRLTIVRYLKENQSLSVGDIADKIRLSLKSTSKHLSILSASGIVEKEQKSTKIFYSLSGNQEPVIKQIIQLI